MSEQLIKDFLEGRCSSDVSLSEAKQFLCQSNERVEKCLSLLF